MTKKTSHWVTIPEETVHTPVSKEKKQSEESSMPLRNKIFWGAGFVILVVLTITLIAPNQMASVLQGNLFDQGLEVVPEEGFEDPQSGGQIQEEADEEEAETEEAEQEAETDITVEAQTEAVSIQIEPVDDTAEETEEEAEIEAETEEKAEEAEEKAEETEEEDELDANQKLLEELSQQIAEFKEKDEEKTKMIEELAAMVEEEEGEEELHAAAADTATEATATIGTTAPTTTGYLVNTHTVSMTPHEALAVNTAQYQSAQASYDGVTAEDYSAQLSSADGTVDSGPREVLLVAFALTFIALLGWKLLKIAQA